MMKKNNSKIKIIFWVPAISLSFFIAGALILFQFDKKPADAENPEVKIAHIQTPKIVKGIYLTSYSAGTKRFDELLKLARETEINSFIIDIKTGSGYLAFEPKNQNLKKFADTNIQIPNLDEIIKKAHDEEIYLIARVFVFQDPAAVKKNPQWAVQDKFGEIWKDYRGVSWIDPAVQGIWNYNVSLAQEIYARGFDEINFDYIRFPSDGNLSRMKFNFWNGKNKYETMKNFYSYLNENLRKKGIPISADLFGLTCCNNGIPNIGQNVLDALQYFDAVSQMVYPSHYYSGFIGLSNPASFPYEVVKYSLDKTNKQMEKLKKENPEIKLGVLRPWLQDFDIGDNYDAKKIRAQIQAVYDANGAGWMIWNARNVFTENGFLKE